MFRRSIPILSKQASRTIVRDPRKRKAALSAIVKQQEQEESQLSHQQAFPPPFAPTEQNQQSLGSSLGSYALAGAGMAMGFALVRVVFGV
jgi:hypothetical protein